jgi:hypothetical protein
MAEINLTQAEANALIAMEKHSVGDTRHTYPLPGESISALLASADKREQFLLDVRRGRIDLLKITHQNRGRAVVVLVRLDLGGPAHRNPDDEEIPCPHLHIYREGFGDKWAVPVPLTTFPDTSDRWRTLQDFMTYCNVTKPPAIDNVLI